MQQLSLAAQSRANTGKGAARSLRRAGQVPAVLYGDGIESRALTIEHRVIERLLEAIGGEAALLDVAIDGAAPVKALVREVQRNPLRRAEVIHLDLYAVVADKPITVEIPVHITGTAEGVRNQGGVLDHQLHRLEILVLPGDIPERIEVDVTSLTVGHSIHVRDITVPKAEVLNDPDASVVSVVVSKAEEAAATEATTAEPEVIKKGKDEGEAGEAGAGGEGSAE